MLMARHLQRRGFADASKIASALKQAQAGDAKSAFSSLNGESGWSDSSQIGQVMPLFAYGADKEAQNKVEKYFKQQFRKLTPSDAFTICKDGDAEQKQLKGLDESFWVWETLEEALRPNVDSFSREDFNTMMTFFSRNYKGSEVFWAYAMERISREDSKLI